MAGFGRRLSTKSGLIGGRGRGFGAADSSTSRLSFSNPPPNLAQISDSNLVVSFKSLSKKNDTTLAKALDDILAFVKTHPDEEGGGIEDAVIKAWSELYPRLSINNSRRVRELSHLIQHQILDSAKSRIQPYIPQMLPTWLAGTFDSDKGAAKAAKDGLEVLLNTAEKRSTALKKLQQVILAYVQGGLDETPSTLSDERTMSAEDLKAVYFRMIGNSIDMVTSLLKTLTEDDIRKYKDKYEALLGNEELLEFASSEDVHLRRSSLQLISAYVFRQPSAVKANLKAIGHALISDALRGPQLGSTYDLVETLKVLTTKFPEVWPLSSKPKKDPLARLRSFIEKGSQRGPSEYWKSLVALILVIPEETFPPKVSSILELMSALRTGMSNRDEPKTNLLVAYAAYLTIAHSFATTRLTDTESQVKLIRDSLFPAIENFIVIDPGQTTWSIATSDNIKEALRTCLTLKLSPTCEKAGDQIQISLKQELKLWSQKLTDRLLDPISVETRDYKKAQDNIQSGFVRWFLLLEWVWADRDLRYLQNRLPEADSLMTITQKMMDACAEVLIGRQGKPYAAAAGMLACLRMGSFFMKNCRSIINSLADFLEAHLFDLIGTPSGEYLLAALKELKACPPPSIPFANYSKADLLDKQAGSRRASEIWSDTLRKVLALPSTDLRCSLVASMLLRTDGSQLAEVDQNLQDFVRDRARDAVLSNDDPSWLLFDAAATSKSISREAALEITDIIANALISPHLDVTERGLKALSSLSQKDTRLLISSNDRQLSLLTRLMELSEAQSDWLDAAHKSTIKHLTKVLSETDTPSDDPLANPLIQIIRNQLISMHDPPLSVHTLVNLARNIYANSGEPNDSYKAAALIPTLEEWDDTFAPFYGRKPPAHLGACMLFGGALSLIKGTAPPPPEDLTDDDGHSIALRMALYTCEIMQDVMPRLPDKQVSEILFFLCLTSQLLNVQRLDGKPQLYDNWCDHITAFETKLQKLLLLIISQSPSTDKAPYNETTALGNLVKMMMEQSSSKNPLAYYSALALSSLFDQVAKINGGKFRCSEEWLKEQNLFVKEPDRPLVTLAILSGFKPHLHSSQLVKWFCNHLLALVYGFDGGTLNQPQAAGALTTMIYLDGCLGVYHNTLPPHTARIAMSVKKILSWFEVSDLSGLNCGLAAESCKVLAKLLPAIKSSSGEHWQQTLTRLCLRPWDLQVSMESTDTNPSKKDVFVFSSNSLRMYSKLVKLKEDQDASDDLKEVFVLFRKYLNEGLLGMFTLTREADLPFMAAFDEYLNPEIIKIPIEKINLELIYPMLASLYPVVQATAFEVIKKGLKQMTDDITMKFAVDNEAAEFPDELLSLLLDSECMQPLDRILGPNATPGDVDKIQTSRRQVLLAWELIFSIIAWCPFQVRLSLQQQLKEHGQMNTLLLFINHFFAASDGKLRPLSYYQLQDGIGAFDAFDLSRGLEHSVAWLSASVYHDVLRFTPNLVREWHTAYTRAGKGFMADWTERNFTPTVIRDAIDEVHDWRGGSEVKEYEDGQQLIIRLPTTRGNTITVSYEIDEQLCSISFTLPPLYPLAKIEVKSISRVGIPHKNWEGLVKNIEGCVKFVGTVIDGIEIFRQSITRFMKGHEQCSICYSVISEDMRVPEKKCATCRNTFHSKCLAKWFSSSNNNTCPMCRQNFHGLVTRR
ncbi:hypothetical protein BDZ45DRAFT_732224 [Acephala macrosclerotiorum]|nr:hypothetical protein BDZ45DRAFT_732224 [Acephala macrosclerotiorum]